MIAQYENIKADNKYIFFSFIMYFFEKIIVDKNNRIPSEVSIIIELLIRNNGDRTIVENIRL